MCGIIISIKSYCSSDLDVRDSLNPHSTRAALILTRVRIREKLRQERDKAALKYLPQWIKTLQQHFFQLFYLLGEFFSCSADRLSLKPTSIRNRERNFSKIVCPEDKLKTKTRKIFRALYCTLSFEDLDLESIIHARGSKRRYAE
jgi:hypothetical protein